MPADTEWQVSAQSYLARLAQAEYDDGLRRWLKAGRRATSYRHNPSDYHRALVALLGANNEEAFKARKMLEGYSSAVGV